jgi:hypothetical protein
MLIGRLMERSTFMVDRRGHQRQGLRKGITSSFSSIVALARAG